MTDTWALNDLLAKQACTDLVYRFARGLDRRDEALLRAIFHPDGTDDHGYFKGTGSEFVTWVLPLLASMERTQHLVGNVLVDVAGDKAVSEAYFVASHDLSDGEGNLRRMTTAGRYLDQFKKYEGEWRIFHRQAVYDWNANVPRTDTWDRSEQSERDFGKAGSDDSVYGLADFLKSSA